MKHRLNKSNITVLLSLVFLFIFVFLGKTFGFINNVYEILIITIAINIMLATSLNLILGVAGQFSLGHAGFMAIGAYSVAISYANLSSSLGAVLSIVIGFVIAICLSSLIGLLVALPTLRLKGDYLAIATLGFSEIIRIVILNLDITRGPKGMIVSKYSNIYLILIILIITTIILINFKRSKFGRYCIAIKEDEIASETIGINTTKYKIIAFIIGAIIASIAGGLYAGSVGYISPTQFSFNQSISIMVIVVFGGIGSYTGCFTAAILIGLIDHFLKQFSSYSTVIYGFALVIIMIFKPSGLFGDKEFSLKSIFERKVKKNGSS